MSDCQAFTEQTGQSHDAATSIVINKQQAHSVCRKDRFRTDEQIGRTFVVGMLE